MWIVEARNNEVNIVYQDCSYKSMRNTEENGIIEEWINET